MFELTENRLFYKPGGVLSRPAFFANSLILGALFGACFSLLVLSGKSNSSDLHPLIVFLGGALMGMAVGPVMVLVSGLSCLYISFLYAIVFVVGSLSGSASIGLVSSTVGLIVGMLMSLISAFSYMTIVKRVRDIRGSNQKVHMISMALIAVSLIPIAGTIVFYGLVSVPRWSHPDNRFVTHPVASTLQVVGLITGLFLVLFLIADLTGAVVRRDLNKALKHPWKVRSLNLASAQGEKLQSLPEDIGKLTLLIDLNLALNELKSLPKSIKDLHHLKGLFLDSNQFENIPEEVFELKSLQRLTMGRNNISSVSPRIGELTKLKSLDLNGNPITQLPAEIKNLKQLKYLNVRGTQLNPEEIKKTRDWLSEAMVVI